MRRRLTQPASTRFCKALKARLTDAQSGLGKAYLRLLVDDIRLERNELKIRGSYRRMANAIGLMDKMKLGEVPSFIPEWRARQDSNRASQNALFTGTSRRLDYARCSSVVEQSCWHKTCYLAPNSAGQSNSQRLRSHHQCQRPLPPPLKRTHLHRYEFRQAGASSSFLSSTPLPTESH
jgi:hypothetical protein